MDHQRINCRKCVYFYITWDVKFPNGCRLFKVKSRQAPSVIVYQSTGATCRNFHEKDHGSRNDDK